MEKTVSEMNKQELRDHAKQTFGVDLDMRKNVEALQEQVGKLKPKAEVNPAKLEKVNLSSHLKHPATGFIFPYTDLLAARGDMIPCDEAGNVTE